jgi:peptidoglycan/xylan/chitin deacetylase (PgdA/CDA1 family)
LRRQSGGVFSVDLLDRLVSACKAKFDDSQMLSMLDELVPDIGKTESDTLNWRELSQMHQTGNWGIGSHTNSHVRLCSSTPVETILDEIRTGASEIRRNLGVAPELFAYPNGDLSDGAVEICRQFHVGAVTTRRGWNSTSVDPHLIRRFNLHEGNSSTRSALMASLANV